MNELENLLRQQLHTAADPIQVPIDDQAVLAEGRRARTARTIRWSDGSGGVRFTGLDAAASGPVVLAGPTGNTASTGYEQIEGIRPGFLPAGSIAGQDGRSAAFAVLLPRGASADSLTWDFGRPVTTTVPRSTKVLADGRTWVHEAFSAEGILDWQPGGPTVTYTAADGSRVTARVLNV